MPYFRVKVKNIAKHKLKLNVYKKISAGTNRKHLLSELLHSIIEFGKRVSPNFVFLPQPFFGPLDEGIRQNNLLEKSHALQLRIENVKKDSKNPL